MMKLRGIDETLRDKRILLRVDFDVPFASDGTIRDVTRIQTAVPTIQKLLAQHNTLILVSKMGNPTGRDQQYSLKTIQPLLETLLPTIQIQFVDDFLQTDQSIFAQQKQTQILLLENMRFYPEEKSNDPAFIAKLGKLADVFVFDAFAMAHREEASVTGLARMLPSYAGLHVQEEVENITRIMSNPKQPCVAIIGGAKIQTKLPLLFSLLPKVDTFLIGGSLANTFLKANGLPIGQSQYEDNQVSKAQEFLHQATTRNKTVLLPVDVIGTSPLSEKHYLSLVSRLLNTFQIGDIGSETRRIYSEKIATAQTILWNGPLGRIEDPALQEGTLALFHAITNNTQAQSLVGGGDTLALVGNLSEKTNISYISTGGGAMLAFLEKGTLPILEILRLP